MPKPDAELRWRENCESVEARNSVAISDTSIASGNAAPANSAAKKKFSATAPPGAWLAIDVNTTSGTESTPSFSRPAGRSGAATVCAISPPSLRLDHVHAALADLRERLLRRPCIRHQYVDLLEPAHRGERHLAQLRRARQHHAAPGARQRRALDPHLVEVEVRHALAGG